MAEASTTEPARPAGAGKSGTRRSGGGKPSPRRLARLAAVQALYQIDVSGASASAVVEEFLRDRLVSDSARAAAAIAADGEIDVYPNADRTLFATIVRGAMDELALHDRMIAGALDGRWQVGRLEAVLRAILRAAAFELHQNQPDTPPRVVINEFVDIAHAFYGGREPGLVNGVLDRLARMLDDGRPV